jgi:mRNA interferase RelE/StbE
MRYELIIKPSAEKALDRLPRAVRRRLADAMEALRDDPRPAGAVKLAGEERLYRVRVGDYRIVYDIYDDRLVVWVVRVGHRKDIYRKGG